ncbi:MAG: phosphoribosyltransferase [Planctomycetes bacterium]|nr:phosphoribosyltransferase [Planctomycetota bacterium]
MFEDRLDAGRRLALAMQNYQGEDVVVLAIARGGVPVGYQVARHLHAEFDIIVARKLPYPYNAEAGFGAVAEDGTTFIFPDAFDKFDQKTINEVIHQQTDELYRRINALRAGSPLINIEGKTVILVDDGIAMGSTMRVCVTLCKNRKAKKIVVGSPVSGMDTAKEFASLADDVIILDTPPDFRAVAQVYLNWSDVSDREVIDLVHQWEYEKQQVIGH